MNKNKDEIMTVYEDEWEFWDDIAGKYILKHAETDHSSMSTLI
ncbi:transposase [Pseudomonas sp. IT-232MI5]